jgi:hypothetical protein
MSGFEYDEILEFVQHELKTLAGARLLGGLRPIDNVRYLELGKKERALLAERNRWPRPVAGAGFRW